MLFEVDQMAPREVYQLMVQCITPRPIAWVSTLSPGGRANLAPFSFFNGVAGNPPTVLFCPVNRADGSRKDTLINVEASGEFVVNVVPFALAGAMNATSAEVPYEVDEFALAGVATAPARRVRPPRVRDAPACIECVLHQIVTVGSGALGAHVVIGRIVCIEIADPALTAAGRVDPARLDTVGRMGANQYCRTSDLFELERPAAPARRPPLAPR
jgi:flavin reductase (DIM6/NTAB) family NADH-FMN oxidoreductase RutF